MLPFPERGIDPFEVLPEGWVCVTHNSGMPTYLHKATRVVTLSKPYFLGSGSVRVRCHWTVTTCMYYFCRHKAKLNGLELFFFLEQTVKLNWPYTSYMYMNIHVHVVFCCLYLTMVLRWNAWILLRKSWTRFFFVCNVPIIDYLSPVQIKYLEE